jgi:hypothetical protein
MRVVNVSLATAAGLIVETVATRELTRDPLHGHLQHVPVDGLTATFRRPLAGALVMDMSLTQTPSPTRPDARNL